MKCNKCGSKWEAASSISQIKNCPFCGVALIEEKPAVKLDGPAQVIKDIVDGKYGYDTIHNISKCNALFSDLIPNVKDRYLLEFILKTGFANNILKNGFNLNANDKIKFFQDNVDSFAKTYLSDSHLNKCFNWFSKAILGVDSTWIKSSEISNKIKDSIDNIRKYDTPAPEITIPAQPQPVTSSLIKLFDFIKKKYNLELVKCPAGSFIMGSASAGLFGLGGELGRKDDENQHSVTISKDFYLAKYPVTQAQYRAVMGNNPSLYEGDNNPVESVSWFMAVEFCEKLNKTTELTRPSAYRFDLPTEAQWEYACRAGTNTSLNSGKNITSDSGNCSNLDKVGWYYNNSDSKTHPVGLKNPNSLGIYDMHGNVWEWCRDWYGDYSGNCIDPQGPVSGVYRVYRGGSWHSDPEVCRSAHRDYFTPGRESSILGFRIVLVLSSK